MGPSNKNLNLFKMFMRSNTFFLKTAVIIGLSLAFILPAQSGVKNFGMGCAVWQKIQEEIDDGGYWSEMYLQGLLDGLVFSKFKVQGQKILTETTLEHLKESVDQFCEDSTNAFIPIPFALKIITMKFKGVDDASIQKELEKLRRIWYAIRKENTQDSFAGQQEEFAGFLEASRPVPNPRKTTKDLESTPAASGEQNLQSETSSWTTDEIGELHLHRYFVQGTTVYGHMLAFLKREGQCNTDIMLIMWSAQGSIPKLSEPWVTLDLTVGQERVPITLEFQTVHRLGPLSVFLMSNYFPDQKLIDLLATGTTAKVKLTGPNELVEAVDILEDSFSLHNFTESRTLATGTCKAHSP